MGRLPSFVTFIYFSKRRNRDNCRGEGLGNVGEGEKPRGRNVKERIILYSEGRQMKSQTGRGRSYRRGKKRKEGTKLLRLL